MAAISCLHCGTDSMARSLQDGPIGGVAMAEKSDHAESSDKRWSRKVTENSNALDLDAGVFTWKDPKRIARSLRDSAEHSHRRKSNPFRSAMSMLTFYINRAGDELPASQRKHLEEAKDELRGLYGKPRTR
jgi:Protein of unknown function (DUF3175)